jgi:hypothetical protein
MAEARAHPAPTATEFATAATGPYIPGGFLTL